MTKSDSFILRRLLPVLGAGLLASLPATAQLPFPELRTIFPPGAQAGATGEVAIDGSELEETSELVFSHPGLTAEAILEPASEFYPARPSSSRFRVTVAPDVPAGVYEVMARTRLGFTAPHPFEVGALPEIVHSGDNASPATPMPLPLGTIVNAHTDGDQIDYYRLDLTGGQRVVIACRGEQLDSRIDSTLVLEDGHGRELMRDRDTIGRDAVLDFTAPEDGAYLLHVFDFTYRGGSEYCYRLLASGAPHLDFIDPPAGLPGTTAKYKLYGRNLPGGSKGEGVMLDRHELESIEVEIPLAAHEPPGLVDRPVPDLLLPGMEYCLESNGLKSNPLRIGFAAAPLVSESEAPDDQTVTLPAEIHGRFDRKGDLDRYRFEATKGEPIWIECIAERIRPGTDPLLIIERIARDEQGNEQVTEVSSSDDATNTPGDRRFPVRSRDPSLSFTPADHGTYRVTVLNQSGSFGPAAQYRLVVRPAAPDFDLIATPANAFEPDKQIRRVPTILRRGGTAILEVVAMRKCGFDGEITLSVEGLPAGTNAAPATIRAGTSAATVVLRCAEDAPAWSGFITLKGASGDLVRVAQPGTVSWQVNNWDQEPARTRLSTRFPVSVCAEEEAPLVVAPPEQTRFEVELGGKLEIPVKLLKRVGTKGEIIIRPEGLPYTNNVPQLKLKESDSEGVLAITFQKTNEFNIAPGEYQFSLRAETTLKYRSNPAAAERAEAERKRLEDLEKALQEGAAQAQAAVEPARQAVQEAEQNLNSATAEGKADLEAQVTMRRTQLQESEAAAKSAQEKAQRAGNEKNQATERAKQAAERAKERDVKHATCSLPITVVVKPPPPKEEASP